MRYDVLYTALLGASLQSAALTGGLPCGTCERDAAIVPAQLPNAAAYEAPRTLRGPRARELYDDTPTGSIPLRTVGPRAGSWDLGQYPADHLNPYGRSPVSTDGSGR
jgi:hypothetical protein